MPPVDTLFVKDGNGAPVEIRANPAIYSISGTVNVGNWPATQAVTGTFWQSVQPVSGTFWQATQPVSLASVPTHAVTQSGTWTVGVSGTVPVSGTFWQATQPVSIASMPSTPVTGTFWQATQPMSAAALPLPAGAATEATLALVKAKTDNLDVALSTRGVTGLTDTQLRASAIPVSGTFWPGTQPVSGTFWQVTQPVSLASMPTTPVTGAFWQATQPVSGTFWQPTQPVSGPLTDVQLRASPVPVSGFPAWPYPATVTRVASQSGVLANATATATLAAVAAKTTYLSSVQIFATGATAATAVNATITGLLGGTMTVPFAIPAGANLAATPIILDFATPFPGSAVNTAIVVSLPALGAGNTRATVNAQGFQQ